MITVQVGSGFSVLWKSVWIILKSISEENALTGVWGCQAGGHCRIHGMFATHNYYY